MCMKSDGEQHLRSEAIAVAPGQVFNEHCPRLVQQSQSVGLASLQDKAAQHHRQSKVSGEKSWANNSGLFVCLLDADLSTRVRQNLLIHIIIIDRLFQVDKLHCKIN